MLLWFLYCFKDPQKWLKSIKQKKIPILPLFPVAAKNNPCRFKLSWKSSCRHLGHFFSVDYSQRGDFCSKILPSRGWVIAQVTAVLIMAPQRQNTQLCYLHRRKPPHNVSAYMALKHGIYDRGDVLRFQCVDRWRHLDGEKRKLYENGCVKSTTSTRGVVVVRDSSVYGWKMSFERNIFRCEIAVYQSDNLY